MCFGIFFLLTSVLTLIWWFPILATTALRAAAAFGSGVRRASVRALPASQRPHPGQLAKCIRRWPGGFGAGASLAARYHSADPTGEWCKWRSKSRMIDEATSHPTRRFEARSLSDPGELRTPRFQDIKTPQHASPHTSTLASLSFVYICVFFPIVEQLVQRVRTPSSQFTLINFIIYLQNVVASKGALSHVARVYLCVPRLSSISSKSRQFLLWPAQRTVDRERDRYSTHRSFSPSALLLLLTHFTPTTSESHRVAIAEELAPKYKRVNTKVTEKRRNA